MKCEEFEDRLNQVLDERRRPEWDAELRLHCEGCPACRGVAGSYGVLLDGFYASATPPPPADLAIRVVDELRAQPVVGRRASLAAALLATAAAALFLLPLWKLDRAGQRRAAPERPVALRATQPGAGLAAPSGNINSLPVVQRVLVSLADNDESTDPYEELAKGTGQGLANVVLYMPKIGSTPGMIRPGSIVTGESTWPLQVSEGLKPVTESVSETLDLLLEALPSAPADRRS